MFFSPGLETLDWLRSSSGVMSRPLVLWLTCSISSLPQRKTGHYGQPSWCFWTDSSLERTLCFPGQCSSLTEILGEHQLGKQPTVQSQAPEREKHDWTIRGLLKFFSCKLMCAHRCNEQVEGINAIQSDILSMGQLLDTCTHDWSSK